MLASLALAAMLMSAQLYNGSIQKGVTLSTKRAQRQTG
jgi:hypothetical protein